MSQPQPAAPLDLDAIQARLDAATPGPWTVDSSDYATAIHGPAGSSVVAGSRWGGEASVFDADADAVFIAAARADVEQLLARVRELEDRLDERTADVAERALENAQLRAEKDVPALLAQVRQLEAAIDAVLALPAATDEELEQMDPEAYQQTTGRNDAIANIKQMLRQPTT